ncbi:hypothetical protein [Azospirillum baldaniorum]|uniref:hypothetical protein n=1 Tax=Azospirillum baldaniorum TaxID=1064539 RepID=UPI0031F2F132
MVAADEARLFQGADTPQTRRGRDAGTPREFYVGHPAVILQVTQNPPVNSVEFDPPHGLLGRSGGDLKKGYYTAQPSTPSKKPVSAPVEKLSIDASSPDAHPDATTSRTPKPFV